MACTRKRVQLEENMTIEEKLELFHKTAIDDANAQSVAMVDEYEKSLDDSFEQEKAEIKEKADYLYKTESEKIEHEKNKVLSLVHRDVKRQVLEEKKSFEKILFTLVEKKLQDYMQTEDYTKLLIKQINEAVSFAKDEKMEVYINRSDEDKKEMLEKETGVKILISDTDIMGGTRAVLRAKNVLVDYSFIEKLTHEKEAYTLD
jgi:vacuolar-type H+-ATPase subunit E/Vma4